MKVEFLDKSIGVSWRIAPRKGVVLVTANLSRPSSLLAVCNLLRNLEGILTGGELEDFDA